MTSSFLLKRPADNVADIVDKTKILVDRLRSAVIHHTSILTKDCFDSNATELSKAVESIKKSYEKLNEEYLTVKEEIKSGEKRLNDILEEYKELLEENARLKEVENALLNSQSVADEHEKIAKDLRDALMTYKLLTSVRFDFSHSQDVITGYVAICGDKPSNSTVLPFEIENNDSSNRKLLWEKIEEACLEIRE